MRGACAGQKAPCWVCSTSSERSDSVNWFISLFLFLFRGHVNHRKIYKNLEASLSVLSALVLALTVHSQKETLSTSLLWKDANTGCSLELVYFHQENYSFSPYPSVQKRASGIFLLLLIVSLCVGSFLVALQFINGIENIHNNKIR